MSERRPERDLPARTDEQILNHSTDAALLVDVAAGRVTAVTPETRWDLRRLAREDLLLAGWAPGASVTLLPRGARLAAAAGGAPAA